MLQHSCHLMISLVLLALPGGYYGQEYRSPHSDTLLYFEMKSVDLEASGSYSLLLQDIDHDGNEDILLMAYAGTTAGSEPGEVYWYQWDSVDPTTRTPKWNKYLVAKRKHVVHASFLDVNGDGYEDIVFNSDFEVPPEDVSPQGGLWCALNPGPDNYHPDSEWEILQIGRVVGNHRTATGMLCSVGDDCNSQKADIGILIQFRQPHSLIYHIVSHSQVTLMVTAEKKPLPFLCSVKVLNLTMATLK